MQKIPSIVLMTALVMLTGCSVNTVNEYPSSSYILEESSLSQKLETLNVDSKKDIVAEVEMPAPISINDEKVVLTLEQTYKGFETPAGLEMDKEGNLYISNFGSDYITKIDVNGNRSTFVSGMDTPGGLAFGPDGDLYCADYTANLIYRISPTGQKKIFARGFHTPTGIAFNSAGELLVTNRSSNELVKVDSLGNAELVSNKMATPCAVGEDIAGNLYVANYSGGINRITSDGVVSIFSSEFRMPAAGLDVSDANQIFAVDAGDGCVRRINSDGTTDIVVEGLGTCVPLIVRGNTLYVGSFTTNTVVVYTIK